MPVTLFLHYKLSVFRETGMLTIISIIKHAFLILLSKTVLNHWPAAFHIDITTVKNFHFNTLSFHHFDQQLALCKHHQFKNDSDLTSDYWSY